MAREVTTMADIGTGNIYSNYHCELTEADKKHIKTALSAVGVKAVFCST